MKKLTSILLLSAFALTGCYNAIVTTGETPSSVVIEKPWAMGFVYGLVPPPPIDASETCTNGVAKVDTKLSFLNQLVSGLTFGLITPMDITVTCAAGGSMAVEESEQDNIITVPENATDAERDEIYRLAYEKSIDSNQSVYISHK